VNDICRFPSCARQATTTWALVPLCNEHRRAILDETREYYKGRKPYWGREAYHHISHLIPWSLAFKEGVTNASCRY